MLALVTPDAAKLGTDAKISYNSWVSPNIGSVSTIGIADLPFLVVRSGGSG
jgi:hypothetical protein